MKKLNVPGDVYEAERIERTDDTIIGTTDGREVFRLSGIRDFERYTLEDGADWDELTPSPVEIMEALKENNRQLQEKLAFEEERVSLLEGVVMEMAMNTLE